MSASKLGAAPKPPSSDDNAFKTQLVALIPRVLPPLLDRVRQPPPKQPHRRAAPGKRNRKRAPS